MLLDNHNCVRLAAGTTGDAAGSAAAALNLENRRLQAELREQMAEVRRSRARLVAAADAERRRLERGLDAALDGLAGRAPVPVQVRGRVGGRLTAPVEIAAYFVVSEALANVAKYARAGHATVHVRHERDRLVIDVVDDGCGGASIAAGSGLHGLADRVGALDGGLEIHSPSGIGTRVRAEIPCRAPVAVAA